LTVEAVEVEDVGEKNNGRLFGRLDRRDEEISRE